MSTIFRPARAADLQPATELVVASINELSERHGFGRMASLRPPAFASFSLRDDPAGLWVAEEAGRLVGFGFGWACEELWFLAQLFVSPDAQGSGIGAELMRRSLSHADAARASTRALITFSFNTVSQGLYLRHGMLPRFPIYNLKAERTALAGRPAGPMLRHQPLKNTPTDLERLAQLDARVIGVSRLKHHRYLLDGNEVEGHWLYADDGDECVGYAYLGDGHVGPMAVTEASHAGPALRTMLGLAADGGAAQLSAFIPARCEHGLHTALELGMRIGVPMLMMSDREFGDWARYLPRNPGFM